jgi:hypothetical protein
VDAYRREQRKAFLDLLSVRVPHKLNELMESENATAVRATLALEGMANESQAQPHAAHQHRRDRDLYCLSRMRWPSGRRPCR